MASFGKVANRERKHPGEEASGHQGASGKEESWVRGAQAPGRRVSWAFLSLFTVLGQLALGPGPIGALGLGPLARGTEPGPMVRTHNALLFPAGEGDRPQSEKKKKKKKGTSLTVISWGIVDHQCC